jgi:hypothetical protein
VSEARALYVLLMAFGQGCKVQQVPKDVYDAVMARLRMEQGG